MVLKKMNCQKCKIEIEDRDLRRDALSDAVEAHVSACAACLRFAEERLALRRLVGGLERVSAPPDFDLRMRARLAAESRAAEPRAAWFRFSPAALSWPLAGCLALVASVSLYFQARRPDAPIPAPPVEHSRTAVTETTRSPQVSVAGVTPQDEQGVNNKTRRGVDPALSKISRAASLRRAVQSPRLAGRTGIERAPVQIEESASLSLRGSTPRFALSALPRTEGAPIPVQLDAPEGQLKVLLRDTSGAARTISVDSVSFGSRDVVSRRPGATYTKASLSSNQGVW